MVKININVKKKDLFLITGIMVFIIGSGMIIAYGGTNPPAVGHSLGEIDSSSCTDGQVMTKVGGIWGCGALESNLYISGNGNLDADTRTGTQACVEQGKECVLVFSHNNNLVEGDCTSSVLSLQNCIHACSINYIGIPGNPDSLGNNIHPCDVKIGQRTTYLVGGVVRCAAYFTAMCK